MVLKFTASAFHFPAQAVLIIQHDLSEEGIACHSGWDSSLNLVIDNTDVTPSPFEVGEEKEVFSGDQF